MTQTENPKPSAPNTKTKPQCDIHDDVGGWEVEGIRANVCFNNDDVKEYKGKHYCLFHLPTKDKDIQKFEKSFRNRLEEAEQNLAEIEKLPEEEQIKAKAKLRYDFRYIFFPSELNLSNYKFEAAADFSWATFSASASFMSATFSAAANFISATFSAAANFISATFSDTANFMSATFSGGADFISVKFLASADFSLVTFSSVTWFHLTTFSDTANFSSATFSASAAFILVSFSADANFFSATFSDTANFRSATFSALAEFRAAKVEESAQISFNRTSFQGVTDFSQAIVKGYLYFEAGKGKFFDGEWLDEKKTEPKKIERKTSVFENRLEFAHVRAEKPERITFNKVRLRPSWFVNSDSRKFVFTDIAWENHKASKSELKAELAALIERKFQEPHNFQLLTVAFRNLAANAEEFNRFEEASNFRKSASECERLERLNRQKTKWNELKQHWGKHIICRQFFSEAKKTLTESGKLLWKAPIDLVHFLYRYLSGYGEKWFRAFCWLFVIWFVFAVIYWLAQGFAGNDPPLGFVDSLGYSLQVMTLQRPEPRPEAGLTRVFYGMETIFAPLQAALLALAIRRKFMR